MERKVSGSSGLEGENFGESEYVLEARNIVKAFGNTVALADGNIAIKRGEVHAIVGENGAGKSTLMRILSGVYMPDAGELFLQGRATNFTSPKEASQAGVGIVHQELAICKDISVAENMFLDQPITGLMGTMRWSEMRKQTQTYLDLFGATCSPADIASQTSLGEQQIVEIARAVMNDCKVVIFDEPTSSLSENETETLYQLIRNLKARGISSVFITHRLSEVFLLSDRITIMRDGRWVETIAVTETTPNEVVSMMVGKEISDYYPPKATSIGEEVFAGDAIGDGVLVNDASLHVRAGEILGIAGLVGSGRTELVRAAVGLAPRAAGVRRLHKKQVNISNYADAVKLGICYMTEDRKLDGLFLEQSVESNVVAPIVEKLSKFGFVKRSSSRRLTEPLVSALGIKADSLGTEVKNLSGGNQQKVMIAKWLAAQPQVLFLDEPTRGIDVGAKFEIHRLIRELAEKGLAVVVVSSEIPEIVGLSDRTLVMSEGTIAGELVGKDINEDNIIHLASQHKSLV